MPSRLDIINHLLATVGENGVTTLDSLKSSVQAAKRALDSADREFQGRGWWFNRENNITLLPNVSGEVQVPAETLEFTITKASLHYSVPDAKDRYVKRGNRIYDTRLHTYNIATTIYADLILQLPVDDLPELAGTYLKHLAAERMFLDDDGDQYKMTKLEERTRFAWTNLRAAELKALAVNSQDTPMAQALKYKTGNAGINPRYIGGN